MQIFEGKYGPYVKHGKTNATLPKDADPKEVSLAEAVKLIADKVAKGGGKKEGDPQKGRPEKGGEEEDRPEEEGGGVGSAVPAVLDSGLNIRPAASQ